MKIETVGQNERQGTSRVGSLLAHYDALVDAFGEPTETFKSQAEWAVEIDGVTVTVYDYTRGRRDEPAVEDVTEWHVGGRGPEAREALARVFGREQVQAPDRDLDGRSPFARSLRK